MQFCITVGTATRTVIAGILVHSWLKVLAVNLSRASGRLWLYVGLLQTLSVRILLILPHRCKWVNVSSGTRLLAHPDSPGLDNGSLNGCVCLCVIDKSLVSSCEMWMWSWKASWLMTHCFFYISLFHHLPSICNFATFVSFCITLNGPECADYPLRSYLFARSLYKWTECMISCCLMIVVLVEF